MLQAMNTGHDGSLSTAIAKEMVMRTFVPAWSVRDPPASPGVSADAHATTPLLGL